jgi:endonuclease/exonuclease/phosphatase family metal-dependent hydrolase
MKGEGPQHLEVVSYNIHKGLTPGNLRMVLARMRDALHEVAADLVLVQEVVGRHRRFERRFTDWPAEAQFEFLADTMWPHYAYGRNAVYSERDHGNAILSRFPIVAHDNIDISLHSLEQRGILHAVIEPPGLDAPLHVCCTHLNLLHTHRKRQLRRLAERVEASVPAACPLIIGGDFNDWRTWATGELGRRIGVEEAYVARHGRHARTYPGWHPLLPLDRIYVRGLEVTRARVLTGPPWRTLSDHLALHAEVALARTPASAGA